MAHSESQILTILDDCCESFTFPMLDNGYVYLAATRLALFRSEQDWAVTIEVFGFSPRSGLPDTHVHTFASRLVNRKTAADYASVDAHANYLRNNPHNESRFLSPIAEGAWVDEEDGELVAENAVGLEIRGRAVPVPSAAVYSELGIELEESPRVAVFELCRALAASHLTALLATDEELRHNVPPEMSEVLRLEQWHHPDVGGDERPSTSPTFQQLAEVLVTGDVSLYSPQQGPNTHWRNWPEGGTL